MEDKAQGIAPDSSRGATNTRHIPLTSCVDWFSATFFNVKNWQEICGIICVPESNFIVKEKGINGYSKSAVWDNIQIYFDGHNENMGIFLNMTGQGCRQFESTFDENDWSWSIFLKYVLGYNMNITRFDMAIDDFVGYFTLKQIKSCIVRGCVVSPFRTGRSFEEYLLHDGSLIGNTIYFGKSDVIIRFYDKYGERINKGYALQEDITFWQRTEVQLRGDRAKAAAEQIVNNDYMIGDFLKGILSRYLQFKVKGTQKNRAYWKNCLWWDKFLTGVDKIRLSLTAPDRSILRSKDWIDNQVVASVATLYSAFGSDPILFHYMLKRGQKQMSDEQKKLADDFKLELNQRIMIKDQMREYLAQTGQDSFDYDSFDNINKLDEKASEFEVKKSILDKQLAEVKNAKEYLNELISKYGELPQMNISNHNGKQYDKLTGELLYPFNKKLNEIVELKN